MKNFGNVKFLPLVAAVLGALTAALRWLLYRLVDGRLLLPENHPLQWLVVGLTVAAALLTAAGVWKLDGHCGYRKNFYASLPGGIGAALAAVGVLATVLTAQPPRDSVFQSLWQVLSLVAAACFLWTAYCRIRGKKPFFLIYVALCGFFAVHMLNNYQYWSGTPQIMDFVFSLTACVALMLFSYYQAAFCVGAGKRRMQLFMGMMAGFLCITALSGTDYWYLYCGCGAWALTNLCSFTPAPKPQPRKESEGGDATA